MRLAKGKIEKETCGERAIGTGNMVSEWRVQGQVVGKIKSSLTGCAAGGEIAGGRISHRSYNCRA